MQQLSAAQQRLKQLQEIETNIQEANIMLELLEEEIPEKREEELKKLTAMIRLLNKAMGLLELELFLFAPYVIVFFRFHSFVYFFVVMVFLLCLMY